jgi:hypothetical protein
MTTALHLQYACRQPRYLQLLCSRPEALRPRLATGLPLRCGHIKTYYVQGFNCLLEETRARCNITIVVGSRLLRVSL